MPTFLKFTSVCCLMFCCGCDTCITWCFSKGLCTCVPRNNCCNGVDVISKSYFDRGVFDRQAIAFDGYCGTDSILGGYPKMYAGSCKLSILLLKFYVILSCFAAQYVCCCVDCPEMGNQCMECYFPVCCGGRVFVQPYQTVFGYSLTSFWLCNFCSLCGLKDGEPLCLLEVIRCLVDDDTGPLRNNLESAYNAWFTRVYAKKQDN